MAQAVIVDTDILINFGLDRPNAVQTMAKLEENYTITVSVITAMKTKLISIGNSKGVRIPKPLIEESTLCVAGNFCTVDSTT